MPIDPKTFRHILGHYPTGVCVVSAMPAPGEPAGMAVGSFTSVSLEPPLVAFFPDRRSTSWPKIQASGQFCVNILAHDQEWICRRFATKCANRFEGVSHRLSEAGLPVLNGVVAWIDCALDAVHDAGDHLVVLGAVRALAVERSAAPLIFLRGGYGRFDPLPLAVPLA